MKKLYGICALVFLLFISGCSTNNGTTETPQKEKQAEQKAGVNPTATIEMADGKKIELELYPDKAPNTVANFIALADSGFYNNLLFHRVISGFMIQGGDPNGTGSGGPGYTIKGEFSGNNFSQNDIKHERGVISMARTSQPNSAGSQFFIMHQTSTHLDGQYAAFGKVIAGLDIVDQIASTPVDEKDKPLAAQTIKTITVDKKGGTFTVEKQTT